MGLSLRPAQTLFKSVPDRFVAALPPSCNSNYLGYIRLIYRHLKEE
ncbi:uncharacterized protein SSYIS1_26700 [Serratia symbiotica]|uniref:Uncharacterized protein n=1 Tax=Serratia symbiotica TaxID=138074 RepID=A0A455VI49_9GAMM|nr:uncharacterized protein SSYIS1_26700 [Serratia symbiotica]